MSNNDGGENFVSGRICRIKYACMCEQVGVDCEHEQTCPVHDEPYIWATNMSPEDDARSFGKLTDVN